MKIALATYERLPSLTKNESALIPLFAQAGIEAEAAVWSDPTISWKNFDAVIVRSCWDYHKKIDAFINWLDHLDYQRVKCWNPTEVIRENSRKTYLKDLENQGVNVIPTEWLTNKNIAEIPSIMNRRGWKKVVIKPIVSATAYKTFVVHDFDVENQQKYIRDSFPNGEVFMLQQFMPQISELGEWSLVFFNKTFSHAALKVPKTGEFRVQEDFGGNQSIQKAPDELIAQAKNILRYYQKPILYARVDGLWIDETFFLMELELTEPELFLDDYEKRKRFVQAFVDVVSQNL